MADPTELMEGHLGHRPRRSQHLGEEELKQYEDLSRRLVLSQAEIFYLEKALYEREKDLLIAQERNRQLEEENAKVPDKNSRSLFEQAEQLSALETSVQRARQRLATWHQQGLETSLAATIPVASVSILTPSMENLEPAAERKAGIPEVGEPTEGSLATKHHFAAVVDNIEASFGAYFAEVGQVLGELAKNNVSKGSGKELEAGVPGGPKGQAQAAGVEDDVLQAQIADLQAQIDALTEGAERMQADLAVSAKQTLFLEREVAEKDVQTAALRAEAGALPGLKADLTAAEEHALALQTKLALTANELFRLEAASASQSADLSSAKGQVSALTLDLTARDERITSLLAELETLRAAAAESIKSAEALKAELAVARDAEVAARDAEVATERVARDFEQIAAELEIAARASEQRFAEVERKCAEQAGLILALREQVSVAGGSEGERELPVGISAATDVNAARENGGQGDKGVGLEVNVKAIGQEDSAGASRKVAEEGDETVGSLAEKEMDAIGVAEGEIANRARSEGAVESELPAESEDRTTETQGSFPGQEILHVARDEEAGERTERELRTARDAAEDRAALLEEENVRLVAAVDYVSLENERLVEAIEEERERFAVKMDTLQVEEERLRKALEEESERWEGKVKRLLLENEGLRDGNEEDSARFESEIKERDNERAQLREEIARCAAELEALSAENEALLKRLVEERAKSVGEAEDLRKMVGEERARFANETEVLLFAEERLRADLEEERARFAEQIEGFAHEKAALIAENEEQKQRFDSEMEVVLLENERLKEALETANEQTQAALHELERAGRNQGGTRAEQERAELEVRVRELERACALAQADAERMEAGWREASIRAGELEEKVLGLKRSLYEKEAQLKEAVARAEKLALRGVTGRRVSGDVETETFGRDIATSVPPGKGEGVSVSPGGGSLGIAIALPSTEGIPLEHSPADSRSVSVAGVSDGSESPVTVPGARALLEALGIDSAQSSPSLVSTPPAEEGSPGFHDLVNGQLGFVLSGGANRLLSSGKLIHMDSLDAPARSPGRATGHVAAWDSALEAMTPGGVQFVGPVVQHSGEMAEGDQVEISLSPGGDVSDFGSPVWSGRRVSGSIRKASGSTEDVFFGENMWGLLSDGGLEALHQDSEAPPLSLPVAISPPNTPPRATSNGNFAETETAISPSDASSRAIKSDAIQREDADTDTERSEGADVANESPRTLEKHVITSESSGTNVGLASASKAKLKRNLGEQFESALAKPEALALDADKDAALAAAAALNLALAARVSELELQLRSKALGLNPGSEILTPGGKSETQVETPGLFPNFGLLDLGDVGRVWVEAAVSRSHSRSGSVAGSVSAIRVSTPGRARELEALRDELQRLQEKVAESEALADEVERAHREGVLRAEGHVADHEGFEALRAEVALLRNDAARARERAQERERLDVAVQRESRPRDADPEVQGLEEKVRELERVVRGAREENARMAATWQGEADVGLEALEDELALLRGTRAENEELKGVIRELEKKLSDASQQEKRDCAGVEGLGNTPQEVEAPINVVDDFEAQATVDSATLQDEQPLPLDTNTPVLESPPSEHISRPEELGSVPLGAAALPESSVPADSGALLRLQAEVKTLRAQLEASLVALQWSQAASARLAAEAQGLQGLADGRFSLELEVAELHAELDEERGARGALQDELARARAQLEDLKKETELLASVSVAAPPFATVGVRNPLYESPRGEGFGGGFAEGRPHFDSAVIRSEASSVAEALARDPDVLGRDLNSSVGGSDVLMSGSDALSGNPDALARAADGPARDLDASTRVSNALAGAADGLTRDLDGGAARSLSESSLVRTSEDAEGWLVGEGNLPSERISECFTVQYEPVEDSLFLPGETEQLATGEGHLVVKLATSGAREVLESRRKSLSVVMPTAQEWAFGATPRLNPLFGIEGELFSPLELPKRSQSMTDAVYLHQAGERAGAQCELDRIRNLEKLCFSRGEEVAALRTLLEESQRGAHEGAELRAETERMAAELTWLQALLRRKEEQLAAMAVEKLVNASIEKAAEAGETGGGSAETEVQSGGELVGREEPVDGESNGTEMQRQTEECGAEGGDEEQLSRAASLEVDFLVADFVTGGRSEEESFPVNVETSSQENETVIGAVAGPSEIDKNGVFDGEGSVGEAPDAPASVYVESSSPQDKSVVGGAAAPDGAEEDVVYHVKWSVGERPDALDSVVPPAEAEPETEHGVFAAEPGPGGTELLLLRIDQLKRERDAAVRRARDLEAEGLVDQIDLRVKGAVLEKAAGLVARLREAHAQKRETKGEVTTEGGVRAEKAQLDPNQESGPRKGPEATGKVRERRASAVEEEGRHVALWQAAGKLRCLKEQNEELLRTRPSAHGRLSDASGRTSDVVKRNTESAGRQPDAIGRFADAVESILEPREGSELERGLPVLGPAKTGDYQEVEVVRPEALRTEGGGRKNQNCSGAEELQEQVLLDGELMGALEGLAVEKSAEGKESKIPGAEELSDDVALLEKLKSSRVESRRKKEKLLALREELGSVNSLITERGFAKTDLVVEAGALQMGQVLAAYQQTVEDNQNLDVALGAVREELLLAREALAETFAGESEMSAQKPGSESASDVSESARDLSGELEALLAECARKRGKLRATREDLTDLCKASESSPHLVAEVRSSPVADVEEVQRLSLEIGVRLEERKVLEEAFNSATEELIHARAALADGFAADGNGGGLEGLDEETKNLVTRLADLTEACEQKARKIGAIHRELKEVQELREGVAGHSAPGAESRTANGSGTELERLSAAVEQKQLEARELDERLGAAREELLSARALLAVRFECHVEAGAARGEVDYLTGRLAGVTIECAKKSGMVRVLREELADVMLASVPVTEDEKGEGEGLPTGERERLSELRELRAREKSELQEQLVSVTEQLSQARDAFAAKQRENMPGTRSEEESRSEQRVDANLFEQLSIRLEERSVECARKAGQLRALREELEEARKAVGGTAGGWSGKSAGENGGRSFVTAESFKALSAAFEEKVREEIVLDTSIRAAREGVLSARNATAETFAGQADGEVPKEEGRSVEEFKELSARLEARSLECARKEEKLRVLRAELEEVTGEVGRILRAPLEESSIGESGRGSVDREQFETVSGALEQKTEEARMLDDRIDSVLEELIKARETLAETFANGFKGQCPVKQRRVSGQIFEEVSARLEAQSVECAGKGEKLRTLEAELADVRGLVSDTYSEQPFGGERERSDGEEEGKQVPSEKEASSAGTLNRNAGTTDQAALSGASGQALSLPAQDGLVTPLGDSGGAEDDDADVLCGVSSLLTSSAEAEGQDACPSDSHNETPAHETQPDADSNGPRSSDVRPGTETPAHEFSSNTQSEGPCSSEVRPGEDSQSPRAKPETRWDEAFTAEAYREKAAECSGYQEELRAVKEELQATRKSLTQFYEEIQIFTGQEIEEVIGGAGVEAVRKAVRRASVNVLRVAEAARLQGAEEPTAANNQEEALRSSGYTGILLATEPVPVPAPVAVAVPVQAPALAPSEQAERDLDEVVHSAVLTSAAEAVPLPAPAPAPAPSDQPICESDIDELVHSVTLTSDGEAVASVKSDLAAAESRAQPFAQVSLKEDRGDLQGKLGNAVGSLEAALGSLQAETAARRDLEIDKTADTLVYSAILAVADETVRALKKEVREAESRAAEYEQKSDSLFAELTVTREALAAYNDASQSNENPINSRPENSNEAGSAGVAQRDMTQLVTSAREELRQTAHKLAAARVELTTADAHLALLRAARDELLPGETTREEFMATLEALSVSVESPLPVEEPSEVGKTRLEDPGGVTGKLSEEPVSAEPRETEAGERPVDVLEVVNDGRVELSKLQAELEATRREVSVTRSKLRATNEALSESGGALQRNRADLGASLEELESAHGMVEKAAGELIHLQEAVERTRGEVEASNEDLALTRGKLRATNEALSESGRALQRNRTELVAIIEALESTQDRLARGTGELNNIQEALGKTRGEVKTSNEALALTRGKLRGTNEALSESRRALHRNRADVVAGMEELELAHDRLGKATGESSLLQEALERSREERRDGNEALALTRGKLRATNEALSESRGALQRNRAETVASVKELESAHSRLGKATGELSVLQEELVKSRGEVKASDDDLTLTRGKLRATNEALSESRSALQRNRADIVATLEELESTQDSLARGTGELNVLQEALEINRGEINTSNGDLALTRGKLRATNEALSESRGALQRNRVDTVSSLEELELAHGRLGKATGELSLLREALGKTRGEVKASDEDLAMTRGKLEDTNGEVSDARGQLESAREDLRVTLRELENVKGRKTGVEEGDLLGSGRSGTAASEKETVVTESARAEALEGELIALQALHAATSASLQSALVSLKAEQAARQSLENEKAVDSLVHSAIVAGAEEVLAELKEDLQMAEGMAFALQDDLEYLQAELGAASDSLIESGGSPERNESLFDNEEHRELQAEPTHETDSGQLDAKQGNPPEPSQDNRAEEPGAVSGSLLTPQGPGEPHPGNTGGCDSATWGKAPPVRSADGRLTSQESGVDAFGASGLLVSTLSSYSASEPATRTNSLGAFEFGGLGARARELPSVSEADTRPELEWKALSEQKSLASMSEAGAITEVGGGNLGVEAKTLFDVLAGESKATPLMVAGWRSAAEPVTVCSASCQTEGSFEPTKHYSAGNDPARIAVSGTSNPQVADTGCQASVPSEDQSRPEAFQRKEFLVWAWNPVAVPPSPTGTPERTPQGSFDLPVRVNRVESMLPGSVNGTGTETGAGSGSGSGEVAEAEPRALSKTVVPAWEGTNGMSGLASENFEVPGSGKRFLPVEGRAERPSAESMNPIPVESASAPYGSGVTSGAIQNTPEEECRSEAASFDLPVRVGRLESILGGVSGDQRQETHGGRSPSASFDLPVRVSRPERMLAGYFPSGQKADLNSAEFRSESMLPAEGSGSGIEAVDGPGQITGEVSEKTRLGGNTSGEVTGPEEYWRALVELPALMFEAALFKRQLAELRRQHDVTDRGSKSSPNESQQRKIPNGTEAVLTEREATHRAAVGKLEADLEEETQKRQALEIKRVEAEKDRLALKSEKAVSELVQSAIVAGAKETVVELRGELAATEARAAADLSEAKEMMLRLKVELASHEDRAAAAERQLAAAWSEHAYVSAELENARSAHADVSAQLAALVEEGAARGTTLAAREKAHADVSAELAAALAAHADVRTELEEARRGHADVSTALGARQAAHADVSAELAAARRAYGDVSAELAAAERAQSDAMSELAEARKAHANISAELELAQRTRADVIAQVAGVQKAHTDVQAELEAVQSSRNDVIEQLALAQTAHADVRAELEATKSAYSDVSSELEAAKEAHADVSARLAAAERAWDEAEARLAGAAAEAEDLRAETELAAAEMERELSVAREEVARLESSLAAAGLKIEQISNAAAAAGERFGEVLGAVESDLAAANSRVEGMADEAAAAEERFTEVSAKGRVAELGSGEERRVRELESVQRRLEEEVAAGTDSQKRLEEETVRLREEVVKAQNGRADAERQVEEALAKILNLQAELERARLEVEVWKESLETNERFAKGKKDAVIGATAEVLSGLVNLSKGKNGLASELRMLTELMGTDITLALSKVLELEARRVDEKEILGCDLSAAQRKTEELVSKLERVERELENVRREAEEKGKENEQLLRMLDLARSELATAAQAAARANEEEETPADLPRDVGTERGDTERKGTETDETDTGERGQEEHNPEKSAAAGMGMGSVEGNSTAGTEASDLSSGSAIDSSHDGSRLDGAQNAESPPAVPADGLSRSPLGSFDLPVRVSNFESLLPGDQKQVSTADRSPGTSFDLPVRVTQLESVTSTPPSGDKTGAEPTERSPSESFDLPVRVTRLESLLSSNGVAGRPSDAFDLPERVARLESMLGAFSPNQPAKLTEGSTQTREDLESGPGLRVTGALTDIQEPQKQCPVESPELEAYRAALADLPALMFEAELCKRQLATFRQADVTLKSSKASKSESPERDAEIRGPGGSGKLTEAAGKGDGVDDLVRSAIVAGAEELVAELRAELEGAEGRENALQRELDTLRAELNVAEKVPPELGHSGVIRGLSTEGHVPLTGTGSIEEADSSTLGSSSAANSPPDQPGLWDGPSEEAPSKKDDCTTASEEPAAIGTCAVLAAPALTADERLELETLREHCAELRLRLVLLGAESSATGSGTPGRTNNHSAHFTGVTGHATGSPVSRAMYPPELQSGTAEAFSGGTAEPPLGWAWNPVALPSPAVTPDRTPQGSFDLPVRVNRGESMAQDLGNGSGNGNGEERTPQGSFDLPVRVTRVESMLRGAENGSGSGNGNGRTPQGSFDLPVRVTQVEDMSLIPGNANGTGNGNGNETGSGSGTGEEAEVEQMALGESAEQSPAESLNLPLRITRLESILSGRSTGEQIRSPSDSFDLPERVAVEGTIGLLSPGTAEAGQATGAPALLADQANDVPALVGDQAIDSPALVGLQATDSPALVGDQEENALKSTGEAKNGLQTTALSTRFDSASSTGSFDLPARVSRLESMLTGRDVRVSSFELPRRVEMEGVSAGAMNGMNGDGTIPEQAQIGVSSEENGLGETDLAGHGPHLEGWEHQKRSQSSGREFAESDETLETYRQALVELPALMFEVALLRRQLAGRQQRDVRLTSADCSGNESEEHPNRRALEALVARLREELAMGRKRDADVAIVKEELLSLRAELADREAALVAAAEALRASRIQGLEGLGTSIMHRLSLTVSEPAAGRSEPEEEFGARVGREGKPRAKSETSAALPPMILGLRRASLRGLEVLAWEAIAAERLRSASAPATLQRSAVRADGTDRRRHFDDVIPERLPIQPTEEDESERVTEESEESPFREAPVRKARSEPLALQMDHVSFVDDSVEQELRDQVFSLTSLLSARERAHEEVPALRREVARLERALKQQATESAAARAELEREVSRLRGALEECEARCEVLRAEVLEVTRTRVESAAAGRADELWMVVPRAAAGSEGEEALRQQVQHLQRVIATMVREMAPEEKELAQLRAYSRQQTMVEERASALSLEMTSIQRSVRASLESSDVSSLDGGSSRRLSALDAAAGPRSARASEGFEEHVELFTMGMEESTASHMVGEGPRLDSLLSDSGNLARLEVTVHDISSDEPWLPTPVALSDVPTPSGRSGGSSRAESRRHSGGRNDLGTPSYSRTQSWRRVEDGNLTVFDAVPDSGMEAERKAEGGTKAKRPPALTVPTQSERGGNAGGATTAKSYVEVPRSTVPSASGFRSTPTSPRAALTRSRSGFSAVSSQRNPRGDSDVPGGRKPGTRSAGNSIEKSPSMKSPGRKSDYLPSDFRRSVSQEDKMTDTGSGKESFGSGGASSAASTPPGSPRKRKGPWKPPSVPGGAGRLHLKLNPAQGPEEKAPQ